MLQNAFGVHSRTGERSECRYRLVLMRIAQGYSLSRRVSTRRSGDVDRPRSGTNPAGCLLPRLSRAPSVGAVCDELREQALLRGIVQLKLGVPLDGETPGVRIVFDSFDDSVF